MRAVIGTRGSPLALWQSNFVRNELLKLHPGMEVGIDIIKTTGDSMLVEFASVVDAVRCAVEVQRGMSERNARVSLDSGSNFGLA